jgi:hypothetical protein
MSTSNSIPDIEVLAKVKSWVYKVIIGLNFCPFAKKEMERDTVRFVSFASTTKNLALDNLLDELNRLDKHQEIETSLLIFPQGFLEFNDYLDLVDEANHLIERGGYSGHYQLASFHPDYCFEGENLQDPANYTNRSPYPILHVLRESSIEAVLKRYPEPETIPENNIKKARQLGTEYLCTLLDESTQKT